jgi:hypothetical protein
VWRKARTCRLLRRSQRTSAVPLAGMSPMVTLQREQTEVMNAAKKAAIVIN